VQNKRQSFTDASAFYKSAVILPWHYFFITNSFVCLSQAHRLRPFDSRMLMAVGETYEALERYEEAKMCYRKAIAVGDIEGMANIKLAK